MTEKLITNFWVPITHLVTLNMINEDGLLWNIEVMKYTDSDRTMLRGMPIGRIDGDGFHTNVNDNNRIFKMIFTVDRQVMFFEKNKHIDAIDH